jgi:glycosyltransferase involved in cell wall biosynthesis
MKTGVSSHKNVLLLHVTTAPQSLYHFFPGQIGFMRDRGFRVEAVSSPGTLLDLFAARERIPVHAIEMPRDITPVRDLLALFQLWRLFRALRPQIVHAHTPKASLLAMLAAVLAGVPVRIYHVHGFLFMTASGVRRQFFILAERICCRLSHRILFVSPSIRNIAIEKGICSSNKSRVLHYGSINGIDAQERFNPKANTGRLVRANAGISPNALVIGFVGRIVRDKGIVELMQAWQSLRERFDNLHLLVVGPMEKKDRIPAEVKSRMLSDPRIHYVDEVLDPVNYYAAMDVFAFPSYREGFGLVSIEAAAMSLPVVASRIPGCVDSIVDGETGTLVPPGDADALERALTAYLENSELRKQHGKNGRSMVMEKFCQQKVWEALYEEYCELLKTITGSSPSAMVKIKQEEIVK